jgi:hypothetical protein
LIWIKSRTTYFAEEIPMTTHRHPTIRHCPVCGIAMQAAKLHENLVDFDVYHCLTCDSTIRESHPRTRRYGHETKE